jgi:dTDP-4-amino-4,6-dideoxygalactose transaminase
VAFPSGQLVSRVGDGDVPGPSEDDYKGHVPPLAAESEKRNFLRYTLRNHSEKARDSVILLPLFNGMKEEEVDEVAKKVRTHV